MIRKMGFCFGVLVISFVWPTVSPPAVARQIQAAQNVLVEEVEICGYRRVPLKTILKQVRTRPGGRYNADQVKRDFEAILSLGSFDPLKSSLVEKTGPRGGMMISFRLVEYPDSQRGKTRPGEH